jgi:hypothetical protein
VAQELDISVDMLHSWKRRSEYEDPFINNADVSDEVIQDKLTTFITNHPDYFAELLCC